MLLINTKYFQFVKELIFFILILRYGFSEAASQPGLGPAQMAVIFNNLMCRLGFRKYYVQGGDWGAIIANDLAILYPQNVLGLHSNACVVLSPMAVLKHILGAIHPPLLVEQPMAHKMYPIKNLLTFLYQESGYLHLQATKPDTVGKNRISNLVCSFKFKLSL